MAVDATGTGLNPARLQVTSAIQQAAAATGVSFEYLLAAAKIESNLNPRAAASTSSARGLYQFIEQTWLATMKERGEALGYGQYANAITRLGNGRYEIGDPAAREKILALRNDASVNAALAGALAQMNGEKLAGSIDRAPTDGELYMSHFLGVYGATRLINAAMDTPGVSAAALFPAAAAANRSIFYDRAGRARSASDVYAVLNSRYVTAANSEVTRTALANAVRQAPAIQQNANSAVFLTAFPQAPPNVETNAPLQLAPPGSPPTRNDAPPAKQMFLTLYQVGDRAEPVSPAVQSLWSTARDASANADPQTRRDTQPSIGFDLFSDRAGIFAS
jgi:hypothetical protein